jgi:hypothetical protein
MASLVLFGGLSAPIYKTGYKELINEKNYLDDSRISFNGFGRASSPGRFNLPCP